MQAIPAQFILCIRRPCKNGHLFGLHHGTPDDLPLEVQVEVSATSELGAEYIGQTWHMPLSDFDRISEVKEV